MSLRIAAVLAMLGTGASCAPSVPNFLTYGSDVPAVQASAVAPLLTPTMRWDHRPNATHWTQATLSALQEHGRSLPESVPADIDSWCPAYREAPIHQREMFWAGVLSALSKHESTYRADAIGGGGRYFGLVQISPSTARHHGCAATTSEALRSGAPNLRCAVRIMAQTSARTEGEAKGVAAMARDWGPMHRQGKRNDMKAWLREQAYCRA